MNSMNNGGRTPEYYQIRIQGHLPPYWSEMFNGMQLTLAQSGETILTGVVADQAALHGLLARIRDLNLTLISVIRFSSIPADINDNELI